MFCFTFLLVIGTAIALKLPDRGQFDLEHFDIHSLYNEYVQAYGKVRNPEEYPKRLEIFKKSLEDIRERNAKYPQTEYGLDRFSDLTAEEKQRYFGSLPFDETLEGLTTTLKYPPEAITAPDEWNWRLHNAVTYVKDQLECGSCWVFSAIGNIEGQYAIKYKELLSFSEQQSVDCVKPLESNNNCYGGWPHRSMWHYEVAGITDESPYTVRLEKDYPYFGYTENVYCKEREKRMQDTKIAVTSVKVIKTDEETLKQLLYETGPLSTAMDMSNLEGYHKGIIHPHDCYYTLNHAVLLVGYGIENGTKYWLVKNSFGSDWGEFGYFRILRGVGACSIGIRYTAMATVEKLHKK
ncbi:procathepsin L-like [Cydia pomonella]|uniref:procathepsin L-like n=1 Tax=Cydia pomonella TaxID=82600 RepID=UPI002ADD9671|nr:procathepsin L-like [Cydia pomonella]